MTVPEPSRGDVWDLNFDPTIGREQAGARPALIISVDVFNQGPAELVVAVPITRTQRGNPMARPSKTAGGRLGRRKLPAVRQCPSSLEAKTQATARPGIGRHFAAGRRSAAHPAGALSYTRTTRSNSKTPECGML